MLVEEVLVIKSPDQYDILLMITIISDATGLILLMLPLFSRLF